MLVVCYVSMSSVKVGTLICIADVHVTYYDKPTAADGTMAEMGSPNPIVVVVKSNSENVSAARNDLVSVEIHPNYR